MKIIVLKDVVKVGKKYDVKDVSDGYALNFLIPRKLVEVATKNSLKKVEMWKQREATEKKVKEKLLEKNLKDLSAVKIEFVEKANDKGHLFRSIHKEELAEELKKQAQLDISANFIVLESPLKKVGEHEVSVKIGNSSTKFKVAIKAA